MHIGQLRGSTQLMGLNPGEILKIQTMRAAIALYTGSDPIIKNYDDYSEIIFTPKQIEMLQGQLEQAHSSEPGKIRMNVGPVLTPFYLKKYGPWAAGAVLGAFIIGKLI